MTPAAVPYTKDEIADIRGYHSACRAECGFSLKTSDHDEGSPAKEPVEYSEMRWLATLDAALAERDQARSIVSALLALPHGPMMRVLIDEVLAAHAALTTGDARA